MKALVPPSCRAAGRTPGSDAVREGPFLGLLEGFLGAHSEALPLRDLDSPKETKTLIGPSKERTITTML